MSPDSSKEELQAEADETEVVSSETETPADSPIEDERDELSQLISERDSYLDDLQRVTAEFSNFRKQSGHKYLPNARNRNIVNKSYHLECRIEIRDEMTTIKEIPKY